MKRDNISPRRQEGAVKTGFPAAAGRACWMG